MLLDDYLNLLCRQPHAEVDVAEVALLLARDEYPDLDIEAALSELSAMAHEVKPYLRGNMQARAHGLCRYLFHEMGFRGNIKDYYNPANSYLNLVMEHRTGIPISLSALTIAVGRRAGLPIHGVGLPGHFIVKLVSPGQEVLLDPFHGGRLLTHTDCENLVRQATGLPFEASPINLGAIPLGWMFLRILGNLKGVYLAAEDYPRSLRIMQRMLQLQPENASLHRDLGAAWMKIGQPGKAIDPLAFYLRQVGDQATDAQLIQKLLDEAKTLIARMN